MSVGDGLTVYKVVSIITYWDRNDTVLLIEVFDKVLKYDYLNYMSLSILWITWLYVLIIFTCIEIICEMKNDNYENKRMTLK
jgi:hypothetical protein